MSAIFGILNLDNQPLREVELRRMGERLAHRGPDSRGLWQDGSVGLGHLMLGTTPESLIEFLPSKRANAELVITADARLDNRNDLIADLVNECSSNEPITDSEIILRAYERWGEACPEHLLGDFAFAIWDARRQTLVCARDHFGIKPFLFHLTPSRIFAFASEIKALFCLPEVPCRLDEIKVAAHLAAVADDKTRTFFEDIKRLPPGHVLILSRDDFRIREYWTLDPNRELKLASDEQYAEAFRELFGEAVSCRLRSSTPIGSMLSGGLDSSSITCMARELLAKDDKTTLHTFSAVFNQVPECDESSFQRSVLSQNNVVPHQVIADQISPLTDLDKVIWHQDEPCFAGNLYLHWSQYGPAKDLGIRVMLDGFDGDTTVSHGLGYLTELAQSGRWMALAREVKAYSEKLEQPWLGAYRAWVMKYGINPWISRSTVLRQGKRVAQALNRKLANQPVSDGGSTRWRVPFNEELAKRLNLPERFQSINKKPRTERENHYQLLTRAILPDSLEVLDRAAAAFQLEVRYPFFDKRLVEFCLALPPQQKMFRGWTRMVMRRAMKDVLPAEIQWRGGKSDLGPGFEYGLRTHEKQRLESVFMHKSGLIEQYLDVSAVRAAYERFVAGVATENESLLMWRAASLALWLQSGNHLAVRISRKEETL